MTATEFENIEKLYHYTSIETAKNILKSGALLFHRLGDMNDPYEKSKHFAASAAIIDDIAIMDAKFSEVLQLYQQISFSVDSEQSKMGFDIGPMWGNYADKSKGACLVFDKRKLLQSLPSECQHNAIKYEKDFSPWVIAPKDVQRVTDIENFIDKNVNSLLFSKTLDWQYEQEYRIIIKSKNEEKLRIKDSLILIILNEQSHSIQEAQQIAATFAAFDVETYLLGIFIDQVAVSKVNKSNTIYPNYDNLRIASPDEWHSNSMTK